MLDNKELEKYFNNLSDDELNQMEKHIQLQYLKNSLSYSKEIIDIFEKISKGLSDEQLSLLIEKIQGRGRNLDIRKDSPIIRRYLKYTFSDYAEEINSIGINLPVYFKGITKSKMEIGFRANETYKGDINIGQEYMINLLNYTEKSALLDRENNKGPIEITSQEIRTQNGRRKKKLALGICFQKDGIPKLHIAIENNNTLGQFHRDIFENSISVSENPAVNMGRVIGGGEIVIEDIHIPKIEYTGFSKGYGPIPSEYYEFIKAGLEQEFSAREVILPSINKPKYIK